MYSFTVHTFCEPLQIELFNQRFPNLFGLPYLSYLQSYLVSAANLSTFSGRRKHPVTNLSYFITLFLPASYNIVIEDDVGNKTSLVVKVFEYFLKSTLVKHALIRNLL